MATPKEIEEKADRIADEILEEHGGRDDKVLLFYPPTGAVTTPAEALERVIEQVQDRWGSEFSLVVQVDNRGYVWLHARPSADK